MKCIVVINCMNCPYIDKSYTGYSLLGICKHPDMIDRVIYDLLSTHKDCPLKSYVKDIVIPLFAVFKLTLEKIEGE